MKLQYPKDPRTGGQSVTLLLVLLSTSLVLLNVALAAINGTEELPLVREFFFGSLATYTARKFKVSKDKVELDGKAD